MNVYIDKNKEKKGQKSKKAIVSIDFFLDCNSSYYEKREVISLGLR